MMRVLTVRQPWAWAIVHGGKDVENRTRNVAGGYRGPVAIHAGAVEDTGARAHPEIQRLARDVWWTDPSDLLTGRGDQFRHIIGVVDLVDAHEEKTPWASRTCLCESDWAEIDVWHLVLANPRPLVEPLPWRGALGLRELPAEVEADVLRRIA